MWCQHYRVSCIDIIKSSVSIDTDIDNMKAVVIDAFLLLVVHWSSMLHVLLPTHVADRRPTLPTGQAPWHFSPNGVDAAQPLKDPWSGLIAVFGSLVHPGATCNACSQPQHENSDGVSLPAELPCDMACHDARRNRYKCCTMAAMQAAQHFQPHISKQLGVGWRHGYAQTHSVNNSTCVPGVHLLTTSHVPCAVHLASKVPS